MRLTKYRKKLKFTYLYTKYVNVPLVSLYAFVCDKYRSEFASTLSDFFEKRVQKSGLILVRRCLFIPTLILPAKLAQTSQSGRIQI